MSQQFSDLRAQAEALVQVINDVKSDEPLGPGELHRLMMQFFLLDQAETAFMVWHKQTSLDICSEVLESDWIDRHE